MTSLAGRTVLVYLLSDRSRQVTGSTFTIDDGQSL